MHETSPDAVPVIIARRGAGGHLPEHTLAGSLGTPTSLVADAHAAGLRVHVWTMRSDSAFLPRGYGGDPAVAEWRRLAGLGVDGIFGDFPDVGVRALGRAPPRGVTRP